MEINIIVNLGKKILSIWIGSSNLLEQIHTSFVNSNCLFFISVCLLLLNLSFIVLPFINSLFPIDLFFYCHCYFLRQSFSYYLSKPFIKHLLIFHFLMKLVTYFLSYHYISFRNQSFISFLILFILVLKCQFIFSIFQFHFT